MMKVVQKRFLSNTDLFYICAIAFCVMALLLPLLGMEGMHDSHDDLRYPLMTLHFQNAIESGNMYPRWLPDLAGGYGYPTFLFYQPAFFYLATFFHLVTGSIVLAMKLTILAIFLFGGIGCYFLGREMYHRQAGFFAALLFFLVPYQFVNLYVRGDLSELMAVCLSPWPLFFALRLRSVGNRSGWSYVLGLSFSLAAIIYSHPVIAMFFTAVFVVLVPAMAMTCNGQRFSFFTKSLVAMTAALALSSPYWFTVLQLSPYVNLEVAREGYFAIADHFVQWDQFFSRFWGFGSSFKGASDRMPFALGLPHFLLAVLGGIVGTISQKYRVFFLTLLLVYFSALMMMTDLLASIWKKFWFLQAVQFSWRLLGITASLQITAALGLYSLKWNKKAVSGVVLIGLLATALSYPRMFTPKRPIELTEVKIATEWENRTSSFQNFAALNEFLPATVKNYKSLPPRGNRPIIFFSQGVQYERLGALSAHRIQFRAYAERPSRAVILQFYFPGWQVEVNGSLIPESELVRNLGPAGLIDITLEPGESIIKASYDGPPGWKVRNYIIVIILLATGVAFFFIEKYRKRALGFESGVRSEE
jgi:hypothetical protein